LKQHVARTFDQVSSGTKAGADTTERWAAVGALFSLAMRLLANEGDKKQ
jgi:hypothetical protein